jgi:hypothetical protein
MSVTGNSDLSTAFHVSETVAANILFRGVFHVSGSFVAQATLSFARDRWVLFKIRISSASSLGS